MKINIAETALRLFLFAILASTLPFGSSRGNPDDLEQKWLSKSGTAPTGEDADAKKCVKPHDPPESSGGSRECANPNKSLEESNDLRESNEVHSWFAIPEASLGQRLSLKSEGAGDSVRQTPDPVLKDVPRESGFGKPQEEEYIVIQRGEERGFPLSGLGSATRKVRFTVTINPNIHPNDDQLVAYSCAKKPRLCQQVIRDAARKAVADCKKQGVVIAGKARCGETSSSDTDASTGNSGEQYEPKPLVKYLRCAPLDLPRKCEWSCKVLSDRIIHKNLSISWRDANGKKHRSCGYRPAFHKLTWECTAEVRYVKAAGSLKLSYPAKADKGDWPSHKHPAFQVKPKPRQVGVVD
jgi:hypothetical protein